MYQMEDMVKLVRIWVATAHDDDRREFINCAPDKLYKYHHTLGKQIRNEFKLWERDWKPEIVNGIDVSKDHPDQISMSVIVEVWNQLTSAL